MERYKAHLVATGSLKNMMKIMKKLSAWWRRWPRFELSFLWRHVMVESFGSRNAFLYVEIDKDIYMEQPLTYISNSHLEYVCKLKKALYVLKQAPRAWYGKITEYLYFCGYLASNSDVSLFVKNKESLHINFFCSMWMIR